MPSSLACPLRAGTGQAQALQDRDVQRGKVRHVPGVVVATGADRGRRAPPAASTVVTIASAVPSSSSSPASAVRSDAQYTGSARPPASSMARHSASM